MDPKYGEISRAMRNRGVEIYIPGEDEGVGYDPHDIKALLHGVGLVGRAPCETLMSLHLELRSITYGADRSTLSHLVRAALLTQQQLERGVGLKTAMMNACIDVYVRGIKQTAVKQVCKLSLTDSGFVRKAYCCSKL